MPTARVNLDRYNCFATGVLHLTIKPPGVSQSKMIENWSCRELNNKKLLKNEVRYGQAIRLPLSLEGFFQTSKI